MIRLAVRVARVDADLVLAELIELSPGGVEEVEVDADTIEYAVYGAPGELPSLPDVRAAAGAGLVDVATSEVADDWADRWRVFHRPLVVDGRLRVRPPWEPVGPEPIDIVIDPGQAFGTGAHATTALCLELLLDAVGDGDGDGDEDRHGDGVGAGACVDLGCGSGVLAILAARLGFDPVIALDLDPAAVAATRENAVRNGVADRVEVRRFDLREAEAPAADLLVANVLAPPLLTWADRQRELPPRLILSGLLATEADRVSAAYARRGMTERERRLRGEWAALVLGRDRG